MKSDEIEDKMGYRALKVIALSTAICALIVFKAEAGDCNSLIGDLAAYIQQPLASQELTEHVVSAYVTTIQMKAVGADLDAVEVGQVTASPAAFSEYLKLSISPSTNSPVVPYQLAGTLTRYAVLTNQQERADTFTLHISQGQPGSSARVNISLIPPLVPAPGDPRPPRSYRRRSVPVTCQGPFMTGFVDARTTFTVLLVKQRYCSSCGSPPSH